MIIKKTLYEVGNGLLSTGRFRCFDVEDEYTFNIGYGLIDIVHINNGLLTNNLPCQFALKDSKLYFRIVREDSLVFTDTNITSITEVNNKIIIKVIDLPISIRSLIKEGITDIEISNGKVQFNGGQHLNSRRNIRSPFLKGTKKYRGQSNTKSPFSTINQFKEENPKSGNTQKNVVFIKSENVKLSSNIKYSIKNKEENNGILR